MIKAHFHGEILPMSIFHGSHMVSYLGHIVSPLNGGVPMITIGDSSMISELLVQIGFEASTAIVFVLWSVLLVAITGKRWVK